MKTETQQLREEIDRLRERVAVLEALPNNSYPILPAVYLIPAPARIDPWQPPYVVTCDASQAARLQSWSM